MAGRSTGEIRNLCDEKSRNCSAIAATFWLDLGNFASQLGASRQLQGFPNPMQLPYRDWNEPGYLDSIRFHHHVTSQRKKYANIRANRRPYGCGDVWCFAGGCQNRGGDSICV
jgi:hypothetical protein